MQGCASHSFCGSNAKVLPFKLVNAGEQYFLVNVVLFFMLYMVALASTEMSKSNPTVTIYQTPTHETRTFYAIVYLTSYMGLQLVA